MDVDAYLESLASKGADRCKVKGWIVRASLRGLRLARALPESVALQLDPLPVASSWVSLSAYHAALLYVAERRAPTTTQFMRWYGRIVGGAACLPNAGPFFQLSTGHQFLERLPVGWAQMFMGATFTVDFAERRRARIILASPANVFPVLLAESYSAWVCAGLRCSGATDVEVTVADVTDRRAMYEACWNQQHGIWSAAPQS